MTRIILVAIMCLILASCEKENSGSLTDTVWIEYWGSSEHKMTFTSSCFTYDITTEEGEDGGGFTGTYTYDPPTVTLSVDSESYPHYNANAGIVRKGVMFVDVHFGDIILELELKKQ